MLCIQSGGERVPMNSYDQIPEHDRRRIGSALLDVLNQLRSDPEVLAKIKARAAENERRAKAG